MRSWCWPLELLVRKEGADESGDLCARFFEREVAGIDEMELKVLQVAPIGFRAVGRKDQVVLAPDDEGGRLVLAEIFLPLRIKWRIAAVVPEERHLDFLVAGAIELHLVHPPVVRADRFDLMGAVGVLPAGGIDGEQLAEGFCVLFGAVLPVGFEGSPEIAESFVVGVAVLDDERLHALGTFRGKAETDRRTVVHQIEAVAVEAHFLGEGLDDVREVVEGVF